MTNCSVAVLDDRGVVRISGSDAHRLLQDIVTNNLDNARDDAAVHAALLTPQGKILFDFFLLDRGDHLLLETERALIPELIKRLTFYKLRADVTFEDVSADYCVAAAWGGDPENPDGAIVFSDPRLSRLGHRVLAPVESIAGLGCEAAEPDNYHAHRIGLGVPDSNRDYALGDTFPHEAAFDLLSGVDFKKGCYVGQEVVSRMQHRGTARKRIVPVSGDGLQTGATIKGGNSTIGTIGSVAGQNALAMIRLDRAEKAINSGDPLIADDAAIELKKPEWATFDVPGTEQPS